MKSASVFVTLSFTPESGVLDWKLRFIVRVPPYACVLNH